MEDQIQTCHTVCTSAVKLSDCFVFLWICKNVSMFVSETLFLFITIQIHMIVNYFLSLQIV